MAGRREVHTIIRRLQATLASTPSLSTNLVSFNSTPWSAIAPFQPLNLATRHPTTLLESLHHAATTRRWQHAAPSSQNSSTEDPASSAAPNSNNSSADDMQQQVLDTALTLVKQLGWTRNALETAATQLGLSPAIAGSFPRGAAHLVETFNQNCNKKLRELLSERKEEIEEMEDKDRLALGVQLRLEMIIEYLDSWPDALALQAHPSEVAYSLRNYGIIADIIWRTAGDKSVDFTWYTKRAALSGIYISTELFLLTDKSDGYKETWRFLENRLDDMETIEKHMGL